MTAREWEPGDVAMASWRDNPAQRVMRSDRDDWRAIDGDDFEQVTSARPLVVIDPESVVFEGESDHDENRIPEIVNCLRRIAEADGGRTWRAKLCLRLADEFERQARHVKPAEPTGLGAVVEVHGRRWVYTGDRDSGGPWWDSAAEPARWSEFDSATVLSEGVTQ